MKVINFTKKSVYHKNQRRYKSLKYSTEKQRFIKYAAIFTVSLAALYIRYLGRDIISSDFEHCLSSWYREVTLPGPGINSLLYYTGDYPMPYAFLIWLLGKLPVPFLYSLKTVNTIFDFILAVLMGKIVLHFKPENPDSFFLGYSITLLLPNVILNGSFWGQCDGTYSVFLLAAFYCWLKKKFPPMMIFFGLAFSYKLQSVFFLPFVMIAYWLEKEFSILQFLLVPLTMLIMNIPAVLAGYSPMITFTKYMGQAGGYPWLYYFYPNLWFFFQARPYYLFSTGAVLLAVTALLIFVLLLVKKRYGYFMELIAVCLAILNIRNLWIPVLMILCTLPKYLFAVGFADNSISLQMLEAIVNTFLYIAFTCTLWRRLFAPSSGQQRQ